MRNPYRAAARAYRRPMFFLLGVPLALSVSSLILAGTGLRLEREMLDPPGFPREVRAKIQALQPPELVEQAAQTRRVLLVTCLGPSCGALFIGFGIAMSVHLKEMLGDPTSRLIPGLAQAHLTLAGVAVVTGAVASPLAASLALGVAGSALTFVAYPLAIFALSACVAHWRPLALPAIWIAIAVLGFGASFSGKIDALMEPSAAQAAAMLAASIVCVIVVGARLAGFNEEMPEYHRRVPLRVGDMFGASRGAANAAFWWFPPTRDMLSWRRQRSSLEENVFQRAWHWHAAARPTSWIVLMGPFQGGVIAMTAVLYRFSIPELIGSPSISYLAVFPVMMLLGPNRRYLANESLRPHSRKEFVNAVGLSLAAMATVLWLLILAAACVVMVIVKREFPPAPDLLRSIAFSMCCLPILFGIAAWPYRTLLIFYGYMGMFGVMSSFLLIPVRLQGFSPVMLGLICLGLAAIGVLMVCGSYVRWLNDDLGASPTASWIR